MTKTEYRELLKDPQWIEQSIADEFMKREEEIQIGDVFEGWSCGHFFTDQTCKGFTEEGLVIGTNTTVVFDRKYIKLLQLCSR